MPKLVDHEERRRALASAAVSAIGAAGLDGVKLADIAEAAGVTTGALAHYFTDKDAVLMAALEEVCTRIFIKMGEPDGPPGFEEVAGCLPVTPEARLEWRVWLAFWGRAPFAEKLRLFHKQAYADIERAVADDLYGIAPDPAEAAATILAAIDGVGTRATLEPENWPPERQRATLHRLLSATLAEFKSPAA